MKKPNKTVRFMANNMAWTLSNIDIRELCYQSTMDMIIRQRKEAIEKKIAEQQSKPLIIEARR